VEEFINHIHFLRPVWLWGFLAVILIGLFLFINTRQNETWRNSIAGDLLPYLMIKGDQISFLPKIVLIFLLSIMVLSLAGPSWKKVETPGGKIKAAMVILVDASQSMLATDIAPNRLERTKQKIQDLLVASPGAHTAVIAYAGTAHLLMPFTNDYKTLNYQLEALSPKVMPVPGTDLDLALRLADSLLNHIEAPNTLVIFTDNVSDDDINAFGSRSTTLNKTEFFVLATPSGAPIPLGKGRFLKDKNGQTVIPKLDVNNIKELNNLENVKITTVTLDDSDVKRLASNVRRNLLYEKDPELQDEVWQDAGFWLLIPIFLFTLLWFRRGWIVQWCIVLFAVMGFSGCSDLKTGNKIVIEPLPQDWNFQDLWYTRDQQGQKLLDEGKPDEALKKFTDPWQRAAILYQQGKYDEAAAIYNTIPTARSYFNLGLIHAELKNWVQARKAFEQAIEAQPDFKEAKENLEIINQVIAEIKSRYTKNINAEDQNKPGGYSEEKDELNNLKDELETDEEEVGGGQKQNESGQGMASGQQPKDDLIAEEGIPMESQQAKDMILRQLSDDPAVFMQRKFKHQVLTGKVVPSEKGDPW
jgi:Ca-activated chloride channel family protein